MAEQGFNAGSIFVALRAQVDDFKSGIGTAVTTLRGFTKEVGGVATQVSTLGKKITSAMLAPVRAVGSLASSLFTLKGLIAGIIAGAAFDKLVTGPARAAVALERMAARAGIATQQLERLQFIVQAAGGNSDDIAIGIEKLNRILLDAQNGVEEFLPALRKLGIEGLSTGEALNKIVANPNLSAAGLKKLGISEFAVLAKLSRQELDRLNDSFDKLGGGASKRLIDVSRQLQVVKTQLGLAFNNIAERISLLILPKIVELLKLAETFIEQHFPEILGFLDTVEIEVGNLFDAVKRTAQTPGKLAQALQETVEITFTTIGNIISRGLEGFVDIGIAAFKALGSSIIILVGPFFDSLFRAGILHINQILERFAAVVKLWLRDLLIEMLQTIKNSIGSVLPGVSSVIDSGLTLLRGQQIKAFSDALELTKEQKAEFERLAADLQGTSTELTKTQTDKFKEQAKDLVKVSGSAIKDISKELAKAASDILGVFGFSLTSFKGILSEQIAKRRADQQAAGENGTPKPEEKQQPSFISQFFMNFQEKKNQEEAFASFKQQIEDQTKELSATLTQTIGRSVIDGIMQGKSAMETLGDIAGKIFQKTIDNSLASLQKGLTALIQTAFGKQLGGAIAGIAEGLLGIAATIFTILQRKKESSKSFSNVASAVTSTEALRGIVAGPESVAIAAVGDNLKTALEPTNDILRSQLGVLLDIKSSMGGGRGGGLGVPFAGATATT